MDDGRFRELMDDPDTVKMARAIMAAYDESRDIPPRDWDSSDGTLTDYSRAKFLKAADDAFDWVKVALAPKPTEASDAREATWTILSSGNRGCYEHGNHAHGTRLQHGE